MKAMWSLRHPVRSWAIGLSVLVALGVAMVTMLQRGTRPAAKLPPVPLPTPVAGDEAGAVPAVPPASQIASPRTGPTVRGVVRLPGGEPAEGATVIVLRALSAWPEWRSEELDRALTQQDGVFQFRFADAHGLLVAFEHPSLAGGLVEVDRPGETLELALQAGFELSGVVTNDAGVPLANARIALESVPGEERRVAVTHTTGDGRYRFTRLPAGPVRLVARHQNWQPVVQPAVVVGEQRQVDVRFDRAAMAALRGRVLSATTGKPIAGATVELLPLNGKLGLVDPVAGRTGVDGTFLLAGLGRGNMRLFVRHPEYGAVLRTETVGITAADLQIELPRRSRVSGQLVADRGAPQWRGGEVLRLRDSAGQLAFAEVAPDGHFQFAQALSPGWGSIRTLGRPFAFVRSYTTEIDARIEEAETTELELSVRDRTATAIVRGRIVDENGSALAGVALMRRRILAEDARTIGDAATQFDLEAIRGGVAQLFAADRDEWMSITDKAGVFEILGVSPGRLALLAKMAGKGTRSLRVGVAPMQSTIDLGVIQMAPSCRLQGRVLRGGRPLVGASVLVVGAETEAVVVSDGSGFWAVDDLAPGGYRMRARFASQPAGSEVRTVSVAPSGPVPNIVLTLDTGRVVRGVVIGSTGAPLPGAQVTVRGALGSTVATDGEGSFALELPERATELQVALADRSQTKIVPVPGRDEKLVVRLETPPVCTIVAQVAGLPGRKPTGSALLRLTRLAAATEETISRWLELPDGSLRWPYCPTGRVRIEVQCDGYAPFVTERELVANDEHYLGEILLEPGCRLVGEVRAPDGSPVPDVVVMLGEEADLDLFEASTHTDANGNFRLSGVTSRSSRLVVRAVGYAPRVVDLSLPRDVLSPRPLRITLEPGSTIEVAVPRAALRDGAQVQLRRDGRLVAGAEPDENGRVWFANRSPGTYSVHLVGSGQPPRQVVVEAGMQVVRARF